MSSPNVVRSLSADELVSSLPAANRPAPTVAEPVPPVLPSHPESKPKSGLLKRLRRAFRLNAQSMRSIRSDRHSARHHHSNTTHNHINGHHHNLSSISHASSPPSNVINMNGQSHSHAAAKSHPVNSPNASPPPSNASSPPTSPSKTMSSLHRPHGSHRPAAIRSFIRRGSLGSKTMLERPAPEIVESPRGSKRFTTVHADPTKRPTADASLPSTPVTDLEPSQIATSDTNSNSLPNSQPTSIDSQNMSHSNNTSPPDPPVSAPSHRTLHRSRLLRSLPGRVVSSPPSLPGHPMFNFIKRGSASSGKVQPVRPAPTGNLLGEGDSDSSNKLDRLPARIRLYDAPGSMNLSSVSPVPNGTMPSPEHSADAFRTIVDDAVAGRVSFTHLLDAMFRLEERLLPDVKDILVKYLSRGDNMEALIDHLSTVVPSVGDDEGVEGPGGERERYRYSYVSCMLLSNGPIQLRRSLFILPKHLDRLVGVLGHAEPTDPVVVRSVCKVLLSVLRDSPEDTVRAMSRRKDFIDALLSHIAVTGCPEVCLAMLSTVRCQAELKFGPSNKPVVGMMADSKLVDTLCDKLAIAAERGPLDGTASSTIENCSRVIVGIALRALVIPRYEINDDDSDASYMMKFNRDLSSLDVFTEPRPILRLLDSGLIALSKHDTRGYALSTALTAVRYLLVTALNGQDSSLSTIRMQLMTVNTAAYEAGVRARIGKMASVLEHARDGVIVETMWEKVSNPLGVVRLKILELVVVLLQHCSETTANAIVVADMPQILMRLFMRLRLNSLLQHFVAAIVELSFSGKFECLRRSFLLDVRLIDKVMELWEDSCEQPDIRKHRPINYTGELMRMICAVHDFFKRETSESKQMERELGSAKMAQFTNFCEGPVAERLKENGPLYGPGELPPRPLDNMTIDGYASGAPNQGPLLRPRSDGPISG